MGKAVTMFIWVFTWRLVVSCVGASEPFSEAGILFFGTMPPRSQL